MDDKLKLTLQKIKALTLQNKEFAEELVKMLDIPMSKQSVSLPNGVTDDVAAIREALEIRANKSISYDFVKEQRLRDQLIIDNLRMENAALDLKKDEHERFYIFCINAFYQLENIINYYFYVTYPNIKDLLTEVEEATSTETSENFRFKSKGNEKNVGDIPIAHKINAVCNVLFPNDVFKLTLGTLRQVRNEGEHRCMVIQNEKDGTSNLHHFFKYNSFNSVRIDMIKIVTAIKQNIGKPAVRELVETIGLVTSIMPSACFVKYGENTESVPASLFHKVKAASKDDNVILYLKNGKIVDIKIKDDDK